MFEGAGVYYGATPMEAQLCVGQDVAIVGGGNSAGQAAVFLASTARRVHMLVRGSGLAETMSRYLIRRIEENPAIVLRTRTEIVALDGDGRLERVRMRDDRTGEIESHDLGHVFMMTGAVPNTRWLDGCIVLDESREDGPGSDFRGAREGQVAADAPPVSARDQPPWHLCRRRCARRQRQARRVCRWRRIDCRRVRASSAAPVKRLFADRRSFPASRRCCAPRSNHSRSAPNGHAQDARRRATVHQKSDVALAIGQHLPGDHGLASGGWSVVTVLTAGVVATIG